LFIRAIGQYLRRKTFPVFSFFIHIFPNDLLQYQTLKTSKREGFRLERSRVLSEAPIQFFFLMRTHSRDDALKNRKIKNDPLKSFLFLYRIQGEGAHSVSKTILKLNLHNKAYP
jgi:hypothetical protein